jgi:hypothetical protein
MEQRYEQQRDCCESHGPVQFRLGLKCLKANGPFGLCPARFGCRKHTLISPISVESWKLSTSCRKVVRLTKVAAAIAILASCLYSQSLDEFPLLRVIELKGKTYHVQGIEAEADRLWVTSVDRATQSGYLQEFSLPEGALIREVKVQDGVRYHPGGISGAGESLWIPVAEYKANSTSIVQKRSKRTLAIERQFAVQDHIGCIAVRGETVIGGNWDSRDLYFWNTDGALLRKVPNPTQTSFQDMKVVGEMLVGSGGFPGGIGAVEWIDLTALKPIKRITVGKTDRGASFTREGMLIRGDELMLLPEDGSSRLFVFRLKK